jgi:Na+/proline symporter
MIASFVLIMALSLGIALWARRGRKRGQGQGHDDARAFFVAGGQFGALLFFFLSVGETYSIATMLGFPGGVYAGGTASCCGSSAISCWPGPASIFWARGSGGRATSMDRRRSPISSAPISTAGRSKS